MTPLLQGAANLLDAAVNGTRAGYVPSDTAILVGADRSVHVVCASDWSLDSLCRLHGASTAYRVTSSGGTVRVQGEGPGARCTLEAQSAARQILRPRHAAPLLSLAEAPRLK